MSIPIIIDTDLAIDAKFHDIDDLLAILVALNSPELDVLGITTVNGNTSLEKVNSGLERLLQRDFVNKNIVHYSGATQSIDKDDTTNDAVEFMYNKILEYSDDIVLIPIGPLTNIALLFDKHPDVISHIKKISLMGGKLNGWEFNYACDPLAFRKVLSKSEAVDIDILGLEVCTSLKFTSQHWEDLKRRNDQRSAFIVKEIGDWFRINNILRGGFFPYDVFAVMNVINPRLFKSNKVSYKHMRFINAKFKLTRMNIFSKMEVNEQVGDSINWFVDVDKESFLKELLHRV